MSGEVKWPSKKGERLRHLSIADLKAIIEILQEKIDFYKSFLTKDEKAIQLYLQKQEIEDYLDTRLIDLGLTI